MLVIGKRVAVGLVLVLTVVSLLMLRPGAASASCPPDPVDEETGLCASVDIKVPVPNSPGHGSPNPQSPVCPGAPGGECQQGTAWWSSVGQCYAYPLDPQPVPGSAGWQAIAGQATGGTVMACVGGGDAFYVPEGEAAVPDARTIALNAVKQVPFVTAKVHVAPDSRRHTYVYVENWLWVPVSQWRTVEARASVGGTTVTVTADPSGVEWTMGDGNTKVCRSAGRPWTDGMTDQAKTSCGYAYDTVSVKNDAGAHDPRGRFRLTARFHYDVRWSCTGACSAPGGALGEYTGPVSPVTEMEVRQRQTVVRS